MKFVRVRGKKWDKTLGEFLNHTDRIIPLDSISHLYIDKDNIHVVSYQVDHTSSKSYIKVTIEEYTRIAEILGVLLVETESIENLKNEIKDLKEENERLSRQIGHNPISSLEI